MGRSAYDVLLDWARALGLAPRVDAQAAASAAGGVGGGALPPLAMPRPGPGPDGGPEWPDRAPAFEAFDMPQVLRALDAHLADAEAELDATVPDADPETAAYRRLKVEALRDDIRTLREQCRPKAS